MDNQLEKRSYTLEGCELRSEGDKLTFTGHAAVFNVPSEAFGAYREVVKPGAFARSLNEKRDTLFTVNHDPDKLLARTSSGTLKLWEDSKGLAVEAEMPDTTYARDVTALMQRGDLKGMSFVFKAAPGGSKWGNEDGKRMRSLTDLDLFDVSIVALPAYGGTDSDLEFRSLYAAFLEARAGARLSAATRGQIQDAITALQALLADEGRSVDPREMKLELLEKYAL